MIRIAVVEDEKREANQMQCYLARYFRENAPDKKYEVTFFRDAVDFISLYQPVYELIFMDIDMPDLNGMDAARKLREMDDSVVLVFVTNLRQFAVEGYSVDALDFVVKPVVYSGFVTLMNKVLRILSYRSEQSIVIGSAKGVNRVPIKDILYVEVSDHHLVFHLVNGELNTWGTLKNLEKQLPERQFVRCNSGYLINLHFVKKVEEEFVYVGETALVISRAKRKGFITALTDYLQV